jgi:hypothetical protein
MWKLQLGGLALARLAACRCGADASPGEAGSASGMGRPAAARLAVRGKELARFLGQVDPGTVREQLHRASEQAAGTRDAEARAWYERARAAREEQLSALGDIGAARERVLANLSRIAATYQGLPAKVMRLHALDAQATERMYGDLNGELGRMNGELGAVEETLKSFHEVRVGT